jgi:hypothetical protein
MTDSTSARANATSSRTVKLHHHSVVEAAPVVGKHHMINADTGIMIGWASRFGGWRSLKWDNNARRASNTA